MKKLLSVFLSVFMTASALGVTAFAHSGHHDRGHHSSAKVKIVYHCEKDCTYCDDDGDGICDECGNYGYYCTKDCSYCDEDEDGICDNCDTKGVCSYRPKMSRHGRCHH
ncbi:MAG: hypothetical protein K2G04_09845 [Oscillospiraceae bacterium]|nr:hypothetical protein [Oscillospiraceae bacterium]